MNSRLPFGRPFRTLALTGLCLAFGAATLSECSAQTRGGSSSGGSSTGGSAAGGSGAAAGGSFAGQPGNTAAGEIGRSAERQFSDTGGSGQGGGRTGGLGGLGGGGRGFGGFGGFGGLGGLGGFGNAFGMGNTASSKPAVRARLAGPVDVPAEMRVASQLRTQQQVQTTAAQRFVRGYSVSHNDGVATISGTVSSEKDRRMAELLLKLEPGVRRVENQISVSP